MNRMTLRRPSAPRPPLADVTGPLKMPGEALLGVRGRRAQKKARQQQGKLALPDAQGAYIASRVIQVEERASLMARMPAGAPPMGTAPVTRPPRLKAGCRCAESGQSVVVVVDGEMPDGGDADGGCGCRASFSSMLRPRTSSRSTKNCKVGITLSLPPTPTPTLTPTPTPTLTLTLTLTLTKVGITFDAAPAPAPAPAERTGSARRGFSLSGRSSGASEASSEGAADKLVAQHEEGRLRRQRQAEAYSKAMEARTASAKLVLSERIIASDCICVCLCDEGTFGFGNCVCVCVCGATEEGLPSPVGTPAP